MTSLSSSNPSQGALSSFPLLTPDEFDHACGALCDRFHAWQILNPGSWLTIRFMHQQTSDSMLKISRHIENTSTHHEEEATTRESADSWELQLEEVSEYDPVRGYWAQHNTLFALVEYDIVLSPTYQVPVLHFMLRWTNQKGPVVGIDSVYQYLVPDQYRKQLKSVGIMGGISFDYHPISGVPSFFVHPCNTAEAMRHIAGEQNVTPEMYLIIWLGLVGHCVGLHLPPGLFATEEKSARTPETLG